jgi:hypothetical protein
MQGTAYLHSVYFLFDWAELLGNKRTCLLGHIRNLILQIKLLRRSYFRRLCFEYSDLSANYTTHCMLTPPTNNAVKTRQPRIAKVIINY